MTIKTFPRTRSLSYRNFDRETFHLNKQQNSSSRAVRRRLSHVSVDFSPRDSSESWKRMIHPRSSRLRFLFTRANIPPALISMTMNLLKNPENEKLFGHNRRRFIRASSRHLRKQILCGDAQHSVNVARLLCQPSEIVAREAEFPARHQSPRTPRRGQRLAPTEADFYFNLMNWEQWKVRRNEELDFQSFASRPKQSLTSEENIFN